MDTATGSAAETGRAPSLRARLALAFAVLVTVAAFGQALLLYWSSHRSEEALIDRLLDEQLARSLALYESRPDLAFPNSASMTLYVREGDEVGGSLPAWLRALPAEDGRHELYLPGDVEMHVAARRDGERVFYLAYDVAEHDRRQSDTVAALVLTVVLVGVAGGLLSRALAGHLLADLERLAAAVRSDSADPAAGHAAAPLASLARHAETLALARAVDEAQARARAAIARERSFAAAANHELRTPLMQASSTLELLEARLHDPGFQQPLGRLKAAHAELRSLTDALLRVARGATAGASVPCGLRELVDAVLGRVADDARAHAVSLSNSVPSESRVVADPGSLTIVLLNLLRNAIRHSRGRAVEVAVRDGWLSVDDDGEGLPEPPIDGGDAGPTRGTTASTGLGLAIVARVCEANGWALEIGARPQGGTRAAIRIPPG